MQSVHPFCRAQVPPSWTAPSPPQELGLWPTARSHTLNVTSAEATLSSTGTARPSPRLSVPDLPGAGDSFHTTSAAQSERHSADPVVTHSCGLAPNDALLRPLLSRHQIQAQTCWCWVSVRGQNKATHGRAHSRAHTVLPSSRGSSGRGWLPNPAASPLLPSALLGLHDSLNH